MEKRLRPILMEESFRLFGGNSAIVEPFMAALEMIHNYSLVHDDLPAMDNDEYRRGRKTTWNVYGEGMAVLAGDALLNKAFETAAEAFSMIGEAADIAARYAAVAKALQILANKAGIYGMIGGQCADICAEELPSDQVTKELLWYIHKNKTAALIEAALMIGAVLAGASDEAVKKLEQAAENIGIAFQIQDDILDVVVMRPPWQPSVRRQERQDHLVRSKVWRTAVSWWRSWTDRGGWRPWRLRFGGGELRGLAQSLAGREK